MPAIHDPTFLRRIALFRDLDLGDLAVLNGLMRRVRVAYDSSATAAAPTPVTSSTSRSTPIAASNPTSTEFTRTS